MNIKVMYKKDGKYGEECVLAINNKIILLDDSFDVNLAERNMTLEEYSKLKPIEKFSDLLTELVQCYYYSEEGETGLMSEKIEKCSIADYTIISEEELAKEDMLRVLDWLVAPSYEYYNKIREQLCLI